MNAKTSTQMELSVRDAATSATLKSMSQTVMIGTPPTTNPKLGKLRSARRFKRHPLLDAVIDKLALDSDAALAGKLTVSRTLVYRFRAGGSPIGVKHINRMHEITGMPIAYLISLLPKAEQASALTALAENQSRRRGPTPKPHRLLDTLLDRFSLQNDAALAKRLNLKPPVISKIRSGKINLGNSILLRIHEASEIPIPELREMIDGTAQTPDIHTHHVQQSGESNEST